MELLQPLLSKRKVILSRCDHCLPNFIHFLTPATKIYEQASSHDIRGGGINVFPNALGALRSLGIDLSNIRATKVEQVMTILPESELVVDCDQGNTISRG